MSTDSAHGWTARDVGLDLPLADFNGDCSKLWPVSREEIETVRDALVTALVRLVNERPDPSPRILFKWIVLEGMALYQAIALVRRWEELGVDPRVHETYDRLRAHQRGEPPLHELIADLRNGPPRGRQIPSGLKRIIREIQWNLSAGTALRRFTDDPIVVIQPSPLLFRYINAIGVPIRCSLFIDWFEAVQEGEWLESPRDVRLAKQVSQCWAGAFEKGGEKLSAARQVDAEASLAEAFALVRLHRDRLRSRRVPERLFSGAGAYLWAAILASVVRERGGRVIDFDHGKGNGFMLPRTRQFVEFDHCDTYVTYNRSQAKAIKSLIDRTKLIGGRAPVVIAAPDSHRRTPRSFASTVQRTKPIQRLMYVSTILTGDRLHFHPLLPDCIMVDWQRRLFERLAQWGVQLMHKPHPGGRVRTRTDLAEQFGHMTVTRPFEQVTDLADGFLFDFPYSTTFPTALATRKPVVLIDIGYPAWYGPARALFKRRCAVVPASLTERKQVSLDWEALRCIILADRFEWDSAFVRSYLAGT